MTRVSLRTILILGAVLAAALPAGVLGARAIWVGEREHRLEQVDANQVFADVLALTLEHFVHAHLNAVAAVAAEASAGPLDPSRLEAMLRRAVATSTAFDAGLVVDETGVTVSLYPPEMSRDGWARGTSFADHEWFREISAARRPIVDPAVLVAGVGSKPAVAIRAPILGQNGSFRGVVILTLELGEVGGISNRVNLGHSGEVLVTSADGVILSRPRREGEAIPSLGQDPVWAQLSRRPSGFIRSFATGRH
jgi:cache domain-containing protein